MKKQTKQDISAIHSSTLIQNALYTVLASYDNMNPNYKDVLSKIRKILIVVGLPK